MKPPAFQFYPDDFISGTFAFTDEEVGQYVRMLCYQWTHGCAMEEEFLQFIRSRKISPRVLQKFIAKLDGKLFNSRLEAERKKQNKFRTNRIQSGKKGANKRWHSHASAIALPLANDSSPSSISYLLSSDVQSTPTLRAREPSAELPTREQAIAMTANAAVDPDFAGYAFDDWFSRGGRDGANIEVPWLHYATKRWSRERKEWKDGTHKGRRDSAPQKPATGANTVILGKELDRVLERIKILKATYGDHQTWAASDTEEFHKLCIRRAELRKLLGVQV